MKKILISIMAVSMVVAIGFKTNNTETIEIKRGSRVKFANYLFANDFEINNNGRGKITLGTTNVELSNSKMFYESIGMNEILGERALTVEKKSIYGIRYETKYILGKSIIEELIEEIKKM